jgi:transcriptional regulator with XRE-family HTH domain
MMNAFASNLLSRREEKRYTQAFMAIHCGMSQPNYSDIERGKTSPSIEQLRKFAKILDITVDELISEQQMSHSEIATIPPVLQRTEADKDTYIRILENRLRALLLEKESVR